MLILVHHKAPSCNWTRRPEVVDVNPSVGPACREPRWAQPFCVKTTLSLQTCSLRNHITWRYVYRKMERKHHFTPVTGATSTVQEPRLWRIRRIQGTCQEVESGAAHLMGER